MKEDYDVSCAEIYLDIVVSVCVTKGDMVALLKLAPNTGNIRFLDGLNGIRGSCGGNSDN